MHFTPTSASWLIDGVSKVNVTKRLLKKTGHGPHNNKGRCIAATLGFAGPGTESLYHGLMVAFSTMTL